MKRSQPFVVIAVLVSMLAAGLVAAGAVYKASHDKVIEEAFSRLSLFHGLRRATIEDYMLSKASDMRAMSRNAHVVDALEKFVGAWADLGENAAQTVRRLYVDDNPFRRGEKQMLRSAGDESRYTAVHTEFHNWAQRFIAHFGYHDLFLIDRAGNIVYSLEKEDDFATNVAHGQYRNTPLGLVFRKSVSPGGRDVDISDFDRYGPSDNTPASFASSPVLGEDGKIAGVFAVQLPAQPINDMLRSTAGMGETGETYIVGNDLLMRSQSRFIAQPTMLEKEIDTASVAEGLNGFSGTKIISDYRGKPVLSVYSPLDFGGPLWVLIAEIDKSEVLRKLRLWPAIVAGLLAALITGALVHVAIRLILRNWSGPTPTPEKQPQVR